MTPIVVGIIGILILFVLLFLAVGGIGLTFDRLCRSGLYCRVCTYLWRAKDDPHLPSPYS